MKNELTAVQTLANEVLKNFTESTRDNGERFRYLKNGSPEWMRYLCNEAHSGMMPDDNKFEFIFEALSMLSEYEDEDEARDNIEADIYTARLTTWLSSSLARLEYVNEGVAIFGVDVDKFDITKALQLGQWTEKREVFELVLNFLKDRINDYKAS